MHKQSARVSKKVNRSTTLRVSTGPSQAKRSNELLSFDKCVARSTCVEDPTIPVSVRVSVDKIKLVCIHPQNFTYAFITGRVDNFNLEFNMHQDHDSFKGSL